VRATATRYRLAASAVAALSLGALAAGPAPAAAAAERSVADELASTKAAKPQRVVKKTPCIVGRRQARLAKRLRRVPCGASGGEARGDFNGDGIADLAIGTPEEAIGRSFNAGTVTIFYGGAEGLKGGDQAFSQEAIAPPLTANARFGTALASVDFDGDGFGDLAVGAPGTTRASASGVVSDTEHGEVAIIFGSPTGLSTARKQIIEPSLGGRHPIYDRENFGAALVWGQFGGGPEADLAIGAPEKRSGGAVITLHGGPNGLDLASNRLFTVANVFGVDTSDGFMRFGDALTGGDFDGDGRTDLAAAAPSLSLNPDPGTPGADVANAKIVHAGAVVVMRGTASGLTTDGATFLRQGREGLDETPELYERFGDSITAGDLTGDKRAELIVGVPSEDTPGTDPAKEGGHGAVHVIAGSETGLDTANDRLIRGANGSGFGAAVVTGDLQGDGVRDLVVGQPFASVGATSQAGSVQVFYGTASSGLAATSQVWSLASSGVAGTAAASGRYGSALTAWNFGGSPQADLVVGSPGAPVGTLVRAGGFGVLYGSPTGLVSSGSQFITQDTAGVADIAEQNDGFGSAAY
jgi:hypothetical protein